jgi:hypothetical protein
MKRGWFVVAATVLIALLALSCSGGSNPAEPDKVVGVLLKCTMPAETNYNDDGSAYVVPAQEYSGDMCQQLLNNATNRGVALNTAVGLLNARKVITVRTSVGSSYPIEVSATTAVTVGQVWPPAP